MVKKVEQTYYNKCGNQVCLQKACVWTCKSKDLEVVKDDFWLLCKFNPDPNMWTFKILLGEEQRLLYKEFILYDA